MLTLYDYSGTNCLHTLDSEPFFKILFVLISNTFTLALLILETDSYKMDRP